MAYARIQVAIDDGGNFERALDEALRLAKDTSAQLRLVHVVGNAPMEGNQTNLEFEMDQDAARKAGRAILKRAVARAQQAGVAVEPELIGIRTSQYAAAVLAEAERWAAELLVIGTHERGGLSHLLLGSVAEGIIRHAAVPVLVVRSGEPAA